MLTRKQRQDGLPTLTKVHARREQQHFQGCIDRINSMVKQFAQGATLVRPPRLASIHGVKGLVEEEAGSPASIHPRRAVLVQSRCIPEQSDEVDDDKAKSRECDLKVALILLWKTRTQ
jgi:hypothetical protein